MAGYILVDIESTDDEGRVRYVEGVGATVQAYGGEFLASTPEVKVLEGESLVNNRLVLIRFPTGERALEWYGSDQYEPLHRIREQSANTKMIFFESA